MESEDDHAWASITKDSGSRVGGVVLANMPITMAIFLSILDERCIVANVLQVGLNLTEADEIIGILEESRAVRGFGECTS
jgi:hypothetical protein